jgi:hypothetical protein
MQLYLSSNVKGTSRLTRQDFGGSEVLEGQLEKAQAIIRGREIFANRKIIQLI